MRPGFITLLIIFGCWQLIANAAPGDVTTLAGGVFSALSTVGGKIRATSPKTTLKVVGAGGITVSASQDTRMLTITGGGEVPIMPNLTSYYLKSRQSQYSANRAAEAASVQVALGGKAASSHTQNISTVNGLQTALDAKYAQTAHSIYSTAIANQLAARALTVNIPTVCGANPATSVYDGRTPVITFGNGTTADRQRVDGVTMGPHLTGPAGVGGAVGKPALWCQVVNGVRAITYDSFGLNPLPAMTAIAVQVFEGAVEVTAQAYSWVTGGASNRIYGSSIMAAFTPSVKPVFSQLSSNNYVNVLATYSGLYGKRTVICGTPIAVQRMGIQGIQGEPGVSTTSQAQIETAEAEPGGKLLKQAGSTNAEVLYESKRVNGSTSYYVDGDGNIVSQDANGYKRLKFDQATMMLTLIDLNNKTRTTIASNGEYKQYAADGTTVIYWRYSSPRVKEFSTTGKLQSHKEPNGRYTKYRKDGVTPEYVSYSGVFTL